MNGMVKVDRLKKLLKLLKSQDLEGLYITHLPNIRYLSGFTGTSASCLIAEKESIFFTDFRYHQQAHSEVKNFTVVAVNAQNAIPELSAYVAKMGLRRVGFESHILPYGSYRRLRRALARSSRCVPAKPLVERLREIKSREELLVMRRLARMTDNVLAECRSRIRAGVTEREIARCLEQCAYESGADGLSFPPIIASGRNSALPHHRTGRNVLREGSPLLIDFGLALKGYNSDLTRTFHLGKVAERYSQVYLTVCKAQQYALERIKPGIPAGDVDAAAREYIYSRGFGDCFGHGLGHGIGLEVHELPRLRNGSQEILRTGMVFTIEPGIYIPGWGGVRIEDMVLVRSGGYSVLTSSARWIEDNLL